MPERRASPRKKARHHANHINQSSYTPNKVLIGKAVDDKTAAAPEEERFDVFKVGMTMLDYVMILVKISRNVQLKVSKDVADEVKPPYVESKYAGTYGIMPDAISAPILGPRPTSKDALDAWKDKQSLINKGWFSKFTKYEDEVNQMKMYIFQNYVSSSFKLLLESKREFNLESGDTQSLREYMVVLSRHIKVLLKWSPEIEVDECLSALKSLQIRHCLCATLYVSYIKKIKDRFIELKISVVTNTISEIVLIEVPPANNADAIITAQRNAIINANVRTQARHDESIAAVSIRVEAELNRNQEVISAIYNEFVTYGTDVTYNAYFNNKRTERKCPIDKPDHTPFDIRHGGRGLSELLEEIESIANTLKDGHPEKHVYYYEREPVKPLNPIKQPVVVAAITAQESAIAAQNTVIAALQKEIQNIRNKDNRGGGGGAGAAAGGTNVNDGDKLCKHCRDVLKWFNCATTHDTKECKYKEGNKDFIGKEELELKIKTIKARIKAKLEKRKH